MILIFALGRPSLATSQGTSRRTEANHNTVFVVETSAVLALGAPAPEYPDALKAQRLGGEVLVRFVVDTNGSVDRGTLRVIEGTHPLFVDAVRTALIRWKYVPARRDGHVVRQWVQRRISFTVPR
ncbi:MAG: energy transducer TonB [Gemmatimonadaceae bacterium]|nr:energy transducer TonB [Gemmatimonadaceae bacterium]